MTISRDDATAVMDATLQPGASVPRHRHAGQDERFTVVEGEASMWIGRRRLRLGPGQSATVPRLTAPSLRNAGTVPLRVRAELTPGLHTEALFSDLFVLADGGHVSRRGLADLHAVARLARSYGEEVPMLPIVPVAVQRRLLRALGGRGTSS